MSGIVGDFGSKSGKIGGKPWAYLYITSSQSVSSGSLVKIVFTALEGHGSIVNGGWQAPETGSYLVEIVIAGHSGSNNMTDLYLKCFTGTTSSGNETVQFGSYTRQGAHVRHYDFSKSGIVTIDNSASPVEHVIYGHGHVTGTSPYFFTDQSGYPQGTCMQINFLGK